jgi:hypothetical protein
MEDVHETPPDPRCFRDFLLDGLQDVVDVVSDLQTRFLAGFEKHLLCRIGSRWLGVCRTTAYDEGEPFESRYQGGDVSFRILVRIAKRPEFVDAFG